MLISNSLVILVSISTNEILKIPSSKNKKDVTKIINEKFKKE